MDIFDFELANSELDLLHGAGSTKFEFASSVADEDISYTLVAQADLDLDLWKEYVSKRVLVEWLAAFYICIRKGT